MGKASRELQHCNAATKSNKQKIKLFYVFRLICDEEEVCDTLGRNKHAKGLIPCEYLCVNY